MALVEDLTRHVKNLHACDRCPKMHKPVVSGPPVLSSLLLVVYMAAVCRCYPGKNPQGGDRVPDELEIENCSGWLEAEFKLLKPKLVLAVGKLAINQFFHCGKLNEVVGTLRAVERFGHRFDLMALPHPSGASTWHRMEPGKTLLKQSLERVRSHPAFTETFAPLAQE
jgi:uracil-DNA glycosylase